MKPRRRKRWIALGATLFLLGFYHLAFFPHVLESGLKAAVAKFTEADLRLRCKRAGLVFGFVFEDVHLADRRSGKPIFVADRVRIKLALHSLLIGHVGIRELGLYNARAYVTQTDGRWNYEALTGPPAPPAKAEPPPPEEPSGPLPEEISTFVPVKLYANLILHNISFFYSGGRGRNRTAFSVENFNFRLALITRTFRTIPLNADVVGLFDTLVVGLNPHSPLDLRFDGNPGLRGKLGLSFLLYRDEGSTGPEFVTRLHIDSSKLRIGRRGRIRLPVGMALDYDTIYRSGQDQLLIRELALRHHKSVWLEVAARIDGVRSPARTLDLEIRSSSIKLQPLQRLLSVVSGGRAPYFSGTVQLAPLRIRGTLDELQLDGTIRGRHLFYRSAGLPDNRIPAFLLKFDSRLDLYRALPFLKRPTGYDEQSPRAFGVLHQARLRRLYVSYNGATLTGSAHVRPRSLSAQVRLNRFRIDDWGYGQATGFLDGNCSYRSNIQFSAMGFGCKLQATDLRYTMGRSKSGYNQVRLAANGRMTLGARTAINISKLELETRDADENPTMLLAGAVRMAFGRGFQEYDLRADELTIDYAFLRPSLPGTLQHSLAGVQHYLQRRSTIASRTLFRSDPSGSLIRSRTSLAMGFLDRRAIDIDADVKLGKKEIRIAKFEVRGLDGELAITSRGRLVADAKGAWEPDLTLKLGLEPKEELELAAGLLYKGKFGLNADVSRGRAIGELVIDNAAVEQRLGKCAKPSSEECTRFRAEGIELKLPIDHQLKMPRPQRLTDGAQQYLAPTVIVGKPNLRVRFVASSHNPRGEFLRHSYFYTGGVGANFSDGLRARVTYRNNILNISGLEIRSYRPVTKDKQVVWRPQGQISGQRMFFNVADLNPENMEYAAHIQIKDLDLEPFLPKSRSGYDGIISADLEVLGHRLVDPLRNTDVRLSVYRLSPEFSGFVTRLVMPGPIAEGIVNRTLEIPAIKVQLAGGLVYSTIAIKREAVGLGLVIRPGSEEIKQERIPLAQFLANARSEAER